ncbi:glycosyltransferase [Brevundimonas vesicularis]|uniref:glycosyltransferase n=1 Tax=Brevundimonas vesicularis TaxID=41276 RepID=UPI0015745175|nr:glycosyltransferase [Brevundimonas vesicularis]NSX34131.1 glycosyltransferase [Brevundimonas vesicularis]
MKSWVTLALQTRPARVVRKRLRKIGLWPAKPLQGFARSRSWPEILKAGPDHLRQYLLPISPYAAWIESNRLTIAAELDLRARLIEQEPELPRISIITPTFNTSAHHLRAMVSSVQAQIYSNWELCIADDASTSQETLQTIRDIASRDARISVTYLPQNLGISEATNAAVRTATGEVIAFIDHDDLITRDCLGEIALYYADNKSADVVYSDDDKINDEGHRYHPQFKPDWSPVLLLSFMYMSHLLTVRRKLYNELGGFRSQFDGAQDYDFALRAAEKARHVGHVPRILYHWRATEGSTAVSGDAKPESFEAGRRAVQEALDRRGISARATHPQWAMDAKVGMFSVEFPDSGPKVSIIIPTRNNVKLLESCLTSILGKTTYSNYEILIADDDSDDAESIAYLNYIDTLENVRVCHITRKTDGFNFSSIVNQAAEFASGEYILLLNNDTAVIDGRWISQMVGYGSMDRVAAVGARLYFEDGSLQHAGIVSGYNEGLVGHAFRGLEPHDWGYMGLARTAREYSAVTAACMLTPTDLFKQVNGFNINDFAVAYNDVDYCLRLVGDGYSCIYCPDAELFHFEGKSRSNFDNPSEIINLRSAYGGHSDPWYNRNLSLDNEKFEISTRRVPANRAHGIRVAAVSHNLNLEGAPNTLFDLIVGLKRLGIINPTLLSPRDGPLRARYEAEGIVVLIIDLPHVGVAAASYEKGVSELAHFLTALDVQVVVANTLPMFSLINAANRAGLGAIWCQHESEPWDTYFDGENPTVRAWAYSAFGQAYRVTYVANATRLAWAPVQTRSNAQVIRHGIPAERLNEEVARWSRSNARELLGVKKDELVIILMGTVCRRKGQLDLIESLERLEPALLHRLRVYIVGHPAESDYAAAIRDGIGRLPLRDQNRIVVTGGVDDMTLYYAAADISVCTSRIESAPRVIVESMAFGLPILTTPVFGIPELVDQDVNALFYSPGDSVALARLITQLSYEPALRAQLAAASRPGLNARPGYDDMIQQYASLIQEAAMLKERPARQAA